MVYPPFGHEFDHTYDYDFFSSSDKRYYNGGSGGKRSNKNNNNYDKNIQSGWKPGEKRYENF